MRPTTIGLLFSALVILIGICLLAVELAGGEGFRIWQAWRGLGLDIPDDPLITEALLALLNFPLWAAFLILGVLLGGAFGVTRYANDH
jgi:uncharacterized membrane protein